jgi:hypothetical protein
LASPDSRTARVISAYSGGDNRVEMNFPRFSFLGSIGLPTLFGSLILTFLNQVAAEFSATPATHPRI